MLHTLPAILHAMQSLISQSREKIVRVSLLHRVSPGFRSCVSSPDYNGSLLRLRIRQFVLIRFDRPLTHAISDHWRCLTTRRGQRLCHFTLEGQESRMHPNELVYRKDGEHFGNRLRTTQHIRIFCPDCTKCCVCKVEKIGCQKK